jgi:hypothetical protein
MLSSLANELAHLAARIPHLWKCNVMGQPFSACRISSIKSIVKTSAPIVLLPMGLPMHMMLVLSKTIVLQIHLAALRTEDFATNCFVNTWQLVVLQTLTNDVALILALSVLLVMPARQTFKSTQIVVLSMRILMLVSKTLVLQIHLAALRTDQCLAINGFVNAWPLVVSKILKTDVALILALSVLLKGNAGTIFKSAETVVPFTRTFFLASKPLATLTSRLGLVTLRTATCLVTNGFAKTGTISQTRKTDAVLTLTLDLRCVMGQAFGVIRTMLSIVTTSSQFVPGTMDLPMLTILALKIIVMTIL